MLNNKVLYKCFIDNIIRKYLYILSNFWWFWIKIKNMLISNIYV